MKITGVIKIGLQNQLIISLDRSNVKGAKLFTWGIATHKFPIENVITILGLLFLKLRFSILVDNFKNRLY